MRRLRALLSITLLCVLAGVAGGLGLGYILSRQGEWLVPQPWAIYAAALLLISGVLTWLDLRRRPVQTASAAASGASAAASETAAADGAPRMAAEQPSGTAPEQPADDDAEIPAGGVVD